MASSLAPGNQASSRGSLWRNQHFRTFLYQVIAVVLLIAVGSYLLSNTLANLEERSIRTGLGFLSREAGFRIGESVIPYSAADTYGRAYIVGVLNTLRVSVLGRLPLESIWSRGYSFFEEILWLLRKAGARFVEIPIVFANRTRGKSKIDAREALRSLGTLARLAWRS